MTDDQITQRRQVKRKYLLVVIKCLRYLACPWILLQGFDNNDYLTQILYLLKTKYDNITKHLQGQVGHKNIIHEIQNKLLHIMASNVLRVAFSTICKQKLFSTMAKKGTGISNIESLMFYVRSVNDNLDVSKNSIGFYGFGNIKSEIIVNAIKAILVRWHFPWTISVARHMMEWGTWWENDWESPHKSLLSDWKLWQLISRDSL